MTDFPFGSCECDACPVHAVRGPGPAAFDVLRDDKWVKLCTRCDFKGDTKVLLVTKDTDPAPFRAWDALGYALVFDRLDDTEALIDGVLEARSTLKKMLGEKES
jgi:hypothetical protein